jgi:hypothetical protein
MQRPELPSKEEFSRVHDTLGTAGVERLFARYIEERQEYVAYMDREQEGRLREAAALRHYRIWSIVMGTALGICSLGVCAYGIQQRVDILPLAAVLAPISGLVGVFIWGYRPAAEKKH